MTAKTEKKFRDPVCGAEISPSEELWVISHGGADFHFCSEPCLERFKKDPSRYLKSKGFFARFLDRLARANQRAFSQGGRGCSH